MDQPTQELHLAAPSGAGPALAGPRPNAVPWPARRTVLLVARPSAVKATTAQVSGAHPSNTLAEMVSSTIASVKAHLLLASIPPQHGRGHRSRAGRSHAGGLCSAAGLQRRAWRA